MNSNNEVPITSITLRGAGHQVNIVDILGIGSGSLVWGGVGVGEVTVVDNGC